MSKTAFITGGSRGIGKAIALMLAKKGYNIAIAAKTTEPHPKLEGTIFSAAEEVEAAGGKALPLKTDIRSEENVLESIEKTVSTFGGLDILINNASAINLSPTQMLPMKRYDLMHDINVRGTFMVSKHCVPHLAKSDHAHILTLSPPLNMDKKWFGNHLGYTMAKYSMSMTVLGLSEELKNQKIAVNALWPQTTIATAAVQNLLGGDSMIQSSRTPDIMADATEIILDQNHECTGNFFIDEEVLKNNGVSNFEQYAVNPDKTLMKDLFL
ncbi:MAG: NAD(P)-dependent oxidoreductase [Flavobacteriales bacterium]|nr:NAD(P)-dependent oxidoreductase [Flavobacteriales bacterium]